MGELSDGAWRVGVWVVGAVRAEASLVAEWRRGGVAAWRSGGVAAWRSCSVVSLAIAVRQPARIFFGSGSWRRGHRLTGSQQVDGAELSSLQVQPRRTSSGARHLHAPVGPAGRAGRSVGRSVGRWEWWWVINMMVGKSAMAEE